MMSNKPQIKIYIPVWMIQDIWKACSERTAAHSAIVLHESLKTFSVEELKDYNDPILVKFYREANGLHPFPSAITIKRALVSGLPFIKNINLLNLLGYYTYGHKWRKINKEQEWKNLRADIFSSNESPEQTAVSIQEKSTKNTERLEPNKTTENEIITHRTKQQSTKKDVFSESHVLETGIAISLLTITDILLRPGNNIKIIFGSGLHKSSIYQSSLISDAIYIPEIVYELTRKAEKTLVIDSCYDIDFLEELQGANSSNSLEKSDLIVIGTGDVNIISAEIFKYYKKNGHPLVPGLKDVFSSNIVGLKKKSSYTNSTHPNLGMLVAARNPWWHDRLVIICGGIIGTGTIASLWLLLEYVKGNGGKYGNNNINQSVPAKLIEVTPKIYKGIPIKSLQDFNPKCDIRNVDVKSLRILE